MIEENLKKFEDEICKYCRNKECGKGIYTIIKSKELQIKCCDYIPNQEVIDKAKYPCQVIRYYELKGKNI